MSMPERSSTEVTGLQLSGRLHEEAGDLFPLLYKELRKLAHSVLRNEKRGLTIRTTALVHEAFVKLSRRSSGHWKNREHFLTTASLAMRQILVDFFRERKRQKRGGGVLPRPLLETDVIAIEPGTDICALDEALEKLAKSDERKAKVVELRFFGGLTAEETARALNISVATVNRDWQISKAWLHREIVKEEEIGS